MSQRMILVVEDEYLLADDCACLVEKAGFRVAGPFAALGDVERHVDLAKIAGAILDVNLRGIAVYPLLDKLLGMDIPVVLYSGYQPTNFPQKYRELSLVIKPKSCADAIENLCRQLNA
jgi:FixJ family two-component response regulator